MFRTQCVYSSELDPLLTRTHALAVQEVGVEHVRGRVQLARLKCVLFGPLK